MKLLLLSSLLSFVSAQQDIKDPVKDVCRRHWHQTCIIDSKLYIDGGMVYYSDTENWSNDTILAQNRALIFEDVNDTSGGGFPLQHSNLFKNSDIPSVSGGVLWPDSVNKYFYLFGGEYESASIAQGKNAQGFDLWQYDTIYNNWTRVKPHQSQNQLKWPAFGAGATHEDGWGYYYGGYFTNKSTSGWTDERLMLNKLLKYDMISTEWSAHNTDNTSRAEGTLQYIPASAAGMLVYFGGVESDPGSGDVSYSNMSQIHLFDVGDDRWRTQTASGNVPPPRRGFCAGTVWAQDKSSYNIYIYGGISANETGLGDIYVLSLPSFQWFLLFPDPYHEIFKGKAFSSCNIIHDSQLLIIGGKYVNNTIIDCDVKGAEGQHGVFLGQESVEQDTGGNVSNPVWWHEPWNNVTRYRVPDLLKKVIGGNDEGGATAKSPPGGWKTNGDLATYFGRTYSAKVRTATREIPSATNGASSPGHKPNVGAIAGGAVGGVVALIGIIAFVFFCLRSRRQSRNAKSQKADPTDSAHNPHVPEMAHKSVASVSVSQGSTLHSPQPQSPSWSPQGTHSPPSAHTWQGVMPAPNPYYSGSPSSQYHMSGEWGQPGEQVYHQTYYPPPPDPSQSPPDRQHMPAQSAEMPIVKSPANIAELPQMRSPVPLRSHERY